MIIWSKYKKNTENEEYIHTSRIKNQRQQLLYQKMNHTKTK